MQHHLAAVLEVSYRIDKPINIACDELSKEPNIGKIAEEGIQSNERKYIS